MRVPRLKPVFVDQIPETTVPGELYVSMKFATAVHSCCCGCGGEVVTPLSPTDWRITYDGDAVSLKPSIGNWSFPCQSHYWIVRNEVQWSERWTTEEIEIGRKRDRVQKAHHPAIKPEHLDAKPRSASSTSSWWRLALTKLTIRK